MSSRQARSEYARLAGPAVRLVGAAVKKGTLIRTPCVECGATEKIQGHHHNGYDPEHALDVEWLCRSCHLKRHRKSPRRPWERGARAYIAATRPTPYAPGGRTYQFSSWSGPKHLLKTMRRVWGLLVTDEERRAMLDLIEELSA